MRVLHLILLALLFLSASLSETEARGRIRGKIRDAFNRLADRIRGIHDRIRDFVFDMNPGDQANRHLQNTLEDMGFFSRSDPNEALNQNRKPDCCQIVIGQIRGTVSTRQWTIDRQIRVTLAGTAWMRYTTYGIRCEDQMYYPEVHFHRSSSYDKIRIKRGRNDVCNPIEDGTTLRSAWWRVGAIGERPTRSQIRAPSRPDYRTLPPGGGLRRR